ncbi:hypothetical protein CAEBREN_21216 [Caenorhabditis brenneri]|uniref:Uncharacterized protein n=1 Tax=Caenorhabditis brenneri TaxID=135651 RepID=G0PGP3_CAEBE|nr:hypothetical protein CAEBREN_21216 [Caenorhabditis brenneri]
MLRMVIHDNSVKQKKSFRGEAKQFNQHDRILNSLLKQ